MLEDKVVAIWFDSEIDEDLRRQQLYSGDLHFASPTSASLEMSEFARALITDAFGTSDPESAQQEMRVEDYAQLLSELKPRFIHHARSKELIRNLLKDRGCDLEDTYFDVPRLRTSTSDGYLTTGIAYAWHPHRDTWYSAPMAQVNWWMPVYPVTNTNAMAFHLEHFHGVVPNDSSIYNYYEWNAKFRRAAASQVAAETRPLPRPLQEIDLSTAVVPIMPVGGLTIFSGQHLHSSVPNSSGQTRFSIDFRTVHAGDIRNGKSAPPTDAACTGSSIRDFIRASDFAPMPDDVISLFNDGTESSGDLVYTDDA